MAVGIDVCNFKESMNDDDKMQMCFSNLVQLV